MRAANFEGSMNKTVYKTNFVAKRCKNYCSE